MIAKHILRDNAKGYSKVLQFLLLSISPVSMLYYFFHPGNPRRNPGVCDGHRLDPSRWRNLAGKAKNSCSSIASKGSFKFDISLDNMILNFPKYQYVAAMIQLFCEATNKLCQKLDLAASTGEDMEMESLFSRLTLDIIGKAVFNYDFDSLTNDEGIVEVNRSVIPNSVENPINFLKFFTGGLHCVKRSRNEKHLSNSHMGNSYLERYFAEAEESFNGSPVDQWHS